MSRDPERMTKEWWRKWGCLAESLDFEEERASYRPLSGGKTMQLFSLAPENCTKNTCLKFRTSNASSTWIFLYKTNQIMTFLSLESFVAFIVFRRTPMSCEVPHNPSLIWQVPLPPRYSPDRSPKWMAWCLSKMQQVHASFLLLISGITSNVIY